MNEVALIESMLRGIAAGNVIPIRQRVLAFEEEMKKAPSVNHLCQTFHHFAPGLYLREFRMPATVLLTGRIHKHQNMSLLIVGKVATFLGDDIVRLEAPHMQLAPAGMKRIVYAYTDAIWMTIHPNPDDCVSVEELERRLACDTEDEFQAFLRQSESAICPW